MAETLSRHGRELERRNCKICGSSFWCLPEGTCWHCNEFCRMSDGLEGPPLKKLKFKQWRELKRKLRDEFGDDENE